MTQSYSAKRRKLLDLVRFQGEFPRDVHDDLEAIQRIDGEKSLNAVIVRAVRLLAEVKLRAGGKLVLHREDGSKAEVLVL